MPHSSAMPRPISNQGFQYDPALLASVIRERKSRPMSWHPGPARYTGYSAPFFLAPSQNTTTTMEMPSQPLNAVPYGDDNTFSYPMQELPVSNDSFAPFTVYEEPEPMQQPGTVPMDASQVDPGWDVAVSNMSTVAPPMPECWAFDMMSMNNSIPSADVAPSCYESVPSSGCLTGPSTPEFLPIQKFGDEPSLADASLNNQEPENELVGMGLYNSPGMLEPPRQGVSGKGLKLEETFTPSSDNEDEDKDDDDADADEEQDDVEPIKQPVKPPVNLLEKSFFFENDDLEPHAVADTQPFIGFGDQSCMSYGYGWI